VNHVNTRKTRETRFVERQNSIETVHLHRLASQFAPSASIAHLQKTNPEEWARRFHEWAESHDRTTPLLTEHAISRESIYPDRI
jgi:hypothetical protein